MKSRSVHILSTGIASLQTRRIVPICAAAGLLLGLHEAGAVDKYWANGTNDFNLTTNWLGGVPGTNDRGIFSSSLLNPVVAGPITVSGLTFYTPGLTVSGTETLSLSSGNTNNDIAGPLFAAAPGVSTVSAPISIITGTTQVAFSAVLGGELVVSGEISGTRGISKLNYGTLTLAGNNSFTGGINHTGANGNFGISRLNINSDTALGSGGTLTIGTGNGGVTLGNTSGSAHTLANPLALNANSGIMSTWDLPANGSGNLTFTGAATLTGTANGHTLNVVGGTLNLRGGVGQSSAGLALTKTGSGTLVFGGAVTSTGALTFSGGGVVVDQSTGGSLASGLALGLTNTNFTLKGAAAGVSSQTMGAPTLSGRTGIAVDANGGTGTTLTVSDTWTRNAGSTLAITLSGDSTLPANPAVLTSNPTASAGDIVVGNGLAAFATVTDSIGTGFATKIGGNVVRYTGASQLTSSSDGANFITKANDPEYAAGVLTLNGLNHTYNTLHLNTSAGTGTLNLNGAAVALTDRGLLATGSNGFTVESGILGGATELVVHQFATGTLTINSLIGGLTSNGASLTKDGPGALTLGGNNVYTGTTFVNEGTVNITGSVRGAVTVNGSTVATRGTLNLSAASAMIQNTLTIVGGGVVNATVENAITGTASINLNGNTAFVDATVNLPFANSYSGTTTLGTGRLNLGNPAAIGTGTFAINGGRLDNISGGPMTLVNNNAITFGGGVIFTGTDSLNLGTGAINLGTGVRSIIVLDKTLTFGGGASGSGGGITKAGPGTLVLSGANTYTGTTNVDGGVLLLNNALSIPGGIGSSGGTANVAIRGGVIGLAAGDFTRPVGTTATDVQITAGGGGFAAYGGNRIVNLGGAGAQLTWSVGNFVANASGGASTTFTLGAASADGTVDFQNPIILGTGGTATRTLLVDNGSAAIDARLSGGLSQTGGTQSFAKVGPGTLDLAGVNSYVGTTSVAAGGLILSGTLSGTIAVNVSGGATLGGGGGLNTGSNGNVTLFSGASLAPGNTGAGTLTATLGSGLFDISSASVGTGAFKFELGVTSDQVALLSGTLNIGFGELNFDDFIFTNSGGFGAGTYTLFDTNTGIFGGLGPNLSGTANGLGATLGLSLDGQDVILTVVPEPGSAALVLGGLGALLGMRRRSQR